MAGDATRSTEPFAVICDMATSWASYEEGERTIDAAGTPGLLLHAAGATDDGVRTIEVWESYDAWDHHRTTTAVEAPSEPDARPVLRLMGVRHLVQQPRT